MSSTGSFTNLTKENLTDNLPPRNLSTVKRKCNIRRKVEITPLPQSQFNFEAEGVNEPFILSNRNHSESNTSSEPAENPPEVKEPVTQEPATNRNVPDKNDSFEISFASLETPSKSIERRAAPPKLQNKIQRQLKHEFVTPNNKAPPAKVQCSVNMQSYIKTPIDKLCSVKKNERGTKVHKESLDQNQFQNEIDMNPVDRSFKKITVNNVEYVVLNLLGKGGSSEVYQCYNFEMQVNRAIKCVSLENPASATGYINEVKLLQKLQNCNRIIKLYDFEIRRTEKTLLMVLEMGGADLSKILKEASQCTSHMPMYMLIYYWMEMLHAVKQLHSHNVTHLDLKPANFLKAGGSLKLIDFGISRFIQNDMTSVFKAVAEGSFNYVSPEAVSNESSSNVNSPSYGNAKYKTSLKSDVWSLGCILYQMVYRRTPFQHIQQMWVKLAAILNPDHKIEYPEASWVPQKIIDTMKHCLQFNMRSRPSVDELIADYENVFQNF